MPSPSDTEIFSNLAGEILSGTERYQAGELQEDDLPTAADLARLFNYRLETVKKKLRALKENHLIQPISMTPKRYRFNRWALSELEADSPFYDLFCEPDSEYFIAPEQRNYR